MITREQVEAYKAEAARSWTISSVRVNSLRTAIPALAEALLEAWGERDRALDDLETALRSEHAVVTENARLRDTMTNPPEAELVLDEVGVEAAVEALARHWKRSWWVKWSDAAKISVRAYLRAVREGEQEGLSQGALRSKGTQQPVVTENARLREALEKVAAGGRPDGTVDTEVVFIARQALDGAALERPEGEAGRP